MNNSSARLTRLGVIIYLIEKSGNNYLGHTAIMKLVFFLQSIKKLDLGYDFSLYTYGPFDSDVLDDLCFGESLSCFSSQTITFSSGYRYEVKLGSLATKYKEKVIEFLQKKQGELDWVIDNFSNKNALELELSSTIVYVAQSILKKNHKNSPDENDFKEISEKVQKIKPHFNEDEIKQDFENLKSKHVFS